MNYGRFGDDQKKYKLELAKAHKINCGLCPYNKKENKKRRGRPDHHKEVDRTTIRRIVNGTNYQ
jgi:hypothetical protein